MNELDVLSKIKESIRSNRKLLVSVQPGVFIEAWFKGRDKFTDKEFTGKLMEFANKYGLGYIRSIDVYGNTFSIYFWEKETMKLLEV